MYHGVKTCVRSNSKLSESFECLTGVRKGESLSPFLFSMYLNDLEDELSKSECEGIDLTTLKLFLLLYADDITLFSETRKGMQQALDNLHAYCNRWCLTVNVEKTKVMIFRRGGRLCKSDRWLFGTHEVEVVNKIKYLGIVFTSSGSFNEAQKCLAEQRQKAVFALHKYCSKFINLTPAHYCNLFDKLVLPVLCYGCEVWGFHRGEEIEK